MQMPMHGFFLKKNYFKNILVGNGEVNLVV